MVWIDQMMKLRVLIITLLLPLIMSPLAVLGSDISGAQYYGIITVSNNNATAESVSTTCTISTQALIDGGYLNSTANNTALRNASGADILFMPGYGGNPWMMWVPSIGADSYLTYILYTASSSGGEIRYFPGSGGMTCSDNASLELGSNFIVEQSGYITTCNGSDKNLAYKEDAFRTNIYTDGSIMSAIGSDGVETFRPNATGDETNLTPHGDSPNYACVDEVEPDELTTYIDGTGRDLYNLPAHTGSGAINKITLYFRVKTSAWLLVNGAIKSNSTVTETEDKSPQADFGNGVWGTYEVEWATNPADGQVWEWSDIDSLQIGVRLRGPETKCTQVYVEVNYSAVVVTATGVSNGEHTIKTVRAPWDVLDFSGGQVEITGGSSLLNFTDEAFTIIARLNVDAVGAHRGVFIRGDPYGAPPWEGYAFFIGTNGAIYLDTGNGEALDRTYSSADAVAVGNWVTTGVTRSGTTVKVYKDGVDVTTTSGTHANFASSSLTAKIGVRGNSNNYPMDGKIAELIILDAVLSDAEMLAVHNDYEDGIHYTIDADTVALWRMNEGTGTNVSDSSGNDYDGTMAGSVSWSTGEGRLLIYVDDVLEDGEATEESVPNNAKGWTFLQNDVMPYMDYHKISVGGTLKQHIVYEYDATFTDQSGNNNNATPTFRTASSDADVSAELIYFLPIAEAKAPAYVLGETTPFISSTPDITSHFTTTPPTGTFPLAGVIKAIAEATNTPPQLPLLVIACFVILAVSLTVSATMRRYGSGSVFVKILVIAALMGVFIALANFGIDFWMLVVFLIIACALAMASKQLGWT